MRPSRILSPCSAWNSFSGIKGKLVSLKDSLDGCERILQDEFKDYPESALYMIGAIGEANKPEPKTETNTEPKTESKKKPRTKTKPETNTAPTSEPTTESAKAHES